MPATLGARVRGLYDGLPEPANTDGLCPIHPHVGAAFEDPNGNGLRCMAIGLNSYISEEDIEALVPDWLRSWAARRCSPETRAD